MTMTQTETPNALTARSMTLLWKNCPKIVRKGTWTEKMAKKLQLPNHRTCGNTNQHAEKCWKNAGPHVRPKMTRAVDKATDTSGDEQTSKKGALRLCIYILPIEILED